MERTYEDDNIFAKILAGEIPCDKLLESEHSLAFRDIQPQAPLHVLVIPKGRYVDFEQFAAEASDAEILDYVRTVGRVAAEARERGFRLVSNAGEDGCQDVPHLHVHVLGGRKLGRIVEAERRPG